MSKFPVAIPDKEFARNAQDGIASMLTAGRRFTIATWNIAAINNNPFEYWITYKQNPSYEELMINVEKFIANPTDATDVTVNKVFTEDMFTQLDTQFTSTCGWKSVRSYWESDFKDRKIISGFMKVRNNKETLMLHYSKLLLSSPLSSNARCSLCVLTVPH